MSTIRQSPPNQPLTLLYLESDATARTAAKTLFLSRFETLYTAENVEQAHLLYEEHRSEIDVIVTELSFPHASGIDLIRWVREQNTFVTVVALCARGDTAFIPQALELNVDGFLFKPFTQEQLFSTLDHLLEKIYLRYENTQNALLLKQYIDITNASSIISKTDPNGFITFVNDKFCQITGYRPDELLGQQHNIIRHPDMPKSAFKDLWATIKAKKTWQGVVKNRAKNGDPYYVKTTVQPILNANGEIEEFISLRHDITAIMSDKKQLFDYLSANALSVLILIQIEDYTVLEKFYDKGSVEKIEQTFGKTLLYLMPNPWGFQRIYHLENGLYAFAIDRRSCRADKEEIHAVLEQFLANVKEHVVKIDTIEYDISVICSYTYGIFKVFEDAKIGIEQAIATKQPIVYADGLSGIEYDNALKNIETIHTIKTAIDTGNILSYFQPIVDNRTRKIAKYESLVRLVNEGGQLLTPYFFLEVAKKGRYYSKITKIVLDNSFAALLKIPDAAISINLSLHDIEREEIIRHIFQLLDRYPEQTSRIVFELLESEDIRDIAHIQRFIQNVKQRGVKIAIDDFGTGYSNFERMLSYEPDILKIDGSLIRNIDTNEVNRNIVETIVLFAQKQRLETVAEFVENEAIYRIVTDLGVDYSQGYHFGRPELF
ncbi:EAL domain-containing response regulator [Sulfurospirillum cavolei]|uniref:EAL domain-containing response regulator n=2 Tax=Sulfurospirillum TaxID=57665 RepID=UPI001E5C5B47|nr:EAL domain-containing response regulator [Sulfurospirillum cavolei]